MAKNIRDYQDSAFRPLVAASGGNYDLNSLRTADLQEEIKAKQYDRFGSLQFADDGPLYLPRGGFFSHLQDKQNHIVAISALGLIDDDVRKLNSHFEDEGFSEEKLDPALFLFLVHNAQGFYLLKDSHRSPAQASDILGFPDDSEYSGHDINDLIDAYNDVHVYSASKNLLITDANSNLLATEAMCKISALRSQIISQAFADEIAKILYHPFFPVDNLFLALAVSKWKHAFLEIFRCLESVFFLPWIIKLKRDGGFSGSLFELKVHCRKVLHWREKSNTSIEELFELIPSNEDMEELESKIDCISEIKSLDNFRRSLIGRKLYKIRNSLVHHEDFEDEQFGNFTEEQWAFLALYLVSFLAILVDTFGQHLETQRK